LKLALACPLHFARPAMPAAWNPRSFAVARRAHRAVLATLASLTTLAALAFATPARADDVTDDTATTAPAEPAEAPHQRGVELEMHVAPPLAGFSPSGLHVIGASAGVRFLNLFLVEGGGSYALADQGGGGNAFGRAGLSIPILDHRRGDRGWTYRIPLLAQLRRGSVDENNYDYFFAHAATSAAGLAGFDAVYYLDVVGFSMRMLTGFEREISQPYVRSDGYVQRHDGMVLEFSLGLVF
jgi:hypothetical protein